MKWVGRLIAVAFLFIIAIGGYSCVALKRSQPQYDGEAVLPGLEKPVSVERDALGVPTIQAENRYDAARALGFAHAQERFLQMDLQRRTAAGELSELLGPFVIEFDKSLRLHNCRAVARHIFDELSGEEKALLEAYTQGVNAGLDSLGGRPFSYHFFIADPRPWKPIDSILAGLSMYFNLQDSGRNEFHRYLMHRELPEEVYEFFVRNGSPWESTMDGTSHPILPIPESQTWTYLEHTEPASGVEADDAGSPGSNAWAVAGQRSVSGHAMLANDMHLGLRVPNIWYRAALEYPAENGDELRVGGVTLPGMPAIVTGSNGEIAWGFTNAYIDTLDLVELEMDPDREGHYLTPDGSKPLVERKETFQVNFSEARTKTYQDTIWGPVLPAEMTSDEGPQYAIRWVAHDATALNLKLMELEKATSVEEALAVAQIAAIPVQNLVVADARGNIGWTLIGPVPEREGFSGRLPVSFTNGEQGWNGLLADKPELVNPESGLIWTANNILLGGERYQSLGDGGFDDDARAWQIHKRLTSKDKHTPKDMLDLQLDDESFFMRRWADLFLATLDDEAVAGNPLRKSFREAVEDWNGHAAADSSAYLFIREARKKLIESIAARLLAPVYAADPEFRLRSFSYEQPFYQLAKEQPGYLAPKEHESWRMEILAAIDTALAPAADRELSDFTWGRKNTLRMRHPLSYFLVPFRRFFDMPAQPQSGDTSVPRVAGPSFGASQRMVATFGENESIFHMPGGQSGHILSAYYRAGHSAWYEGESTPLEPGPTERTLKLMPLSPEQIDEE